MKMTIEPNKTAVSFKKVPAVIVGSFVALYTMTIAAVKGSSQSNTCGFAPIFSGTVKVAITKAAIIDILSSDYPCLLPMSQVNSIYNAQKVEQT